MLRFTSLGRRLATIFTKSPGLFSRMSLTAIAPCSSHSLRTSARNSSASLLREPFGRPAGLPDWPGCQGAFRCAVFLGVFSPSAIRLLHDCCGVVHQLNCFDNGTAASGERKQHEEQFHTL